MICAENKFALQVSKLSELSASALIFLVHHRVTRGGSKPHVRHMYLIRTGPLYLHHDLSPNHIHYLSSELLL